MVRLALAVAYVAAILRSGTSIATSECLAASDTCSTVDCAKQCASRCGWSGSGCISGMSTPSDSTCESPAANNPLSGGPDECESGNDLSLPVLRNWAERAQGCSSHEWANHGWVTWNGQVLRQLDTPGSWEASVARCQTWGRDFHLYVPQSDNDMTFVKNIVDDQHGTSAAWLGIRYAGNQRVTASRQPHSHNSIRTDTDTSAQGSDRCVAGRRSSSSAARYVIEHCETELYPLCAGPVGEPFPVFQPTGAASRARPNVVLLLAGLLLFRSSDTLLLNCA